MKHTNFEHLDIEVRETHQRVLVIGMLTETLSNESLSILEEVGPVLAGNIDNESVFVQKADAAIIKCLINEALVNAMKLYIKEHKQRDFNERQYELPI